MLEICSQRQLGRKGAEGRAEEKSMPLLDLCHVQGPLATGLHMDLAQVWGQQVR